ncbi:peptidoglycan-binding protein [Streptomyces sp. NPDC021056]|uniref:peptidoglycan-binding protein n=1 Tax=Streptomyces sp. NPDC021056 TaxID=3155012 RepID=UPI0033F966FA
MTDYYVAIDHLESPDPDSPMQVTTTYLGTCDQAHVDEVRAIAALEDSPRLVKEHPHIEGAFMVLRDDFDLDVYVPVGATEYRVYAPDPAPKGGYANGGLVSTMPTVASPGVNDDIGVGLLPPGSNDDIGVGLLPPGSNDDIGLLPRGASGPAYIASVIRFGDQSIGGAMDHPENPPRVTWHTTESPSGRTYFYSIAAYLIRIGAEPQVIYDPESDLLGQFGPLTQSGRALRNDGTRRTNREGKVNIQVEVLGRAASPWTKGFDPATKPNYRKLIAAARAHGVPDVWPAGKPPATAAAAAKGSRSRTTWQTKGGHYAHGQVPGNDHWDPGAIDTKLVPGTAVVTKPGNGSSSGATYTVRKGDTLYSIAQAHDTTVAKLVSLNGLRDADDLDVGQELKLPGATAPAKPAAPRYEPYPGDGFFHGGRHSPLVTALGRRLIQLGFGRFYRFGPGPNWTNADKGAVAAFQRSRPDLAGDADGYPGPKTWTALRIPKI